MVVIKIISAAETFAVRHPVLRAGLPLESCHFMGDDLETTVHFGLFYDDILAGVVSIFEAKNKLFSEEYQYQVRGMAVLEEYQGKDFGTSLFNYCVDYCANQKINFIWFNARIVAVPFYKKMNCQEIGDIFDIESAGKHIVMFKKI